jgi:hypothetical protein
LRPFPKSDEIVTLSRFQVMVVEREEAKDFVEKE